VPACAEEPDHHGDIDDRWPNEMSALPIASRFGGG